MPSFKLFSRTSLRIVTEGLDTPSEKVSPMGRKESLELIRHVPESMLQLTMMVYESMESRSKSDERVLRRLKFIKYRYHGMSVSDAADAAGVSRKTGYNIQEAWNSGGLDGIIPKFSSGPKPRLTDSDMAEIEAHIQEIPMDAATLRRYILDKYGEDFTEKHVRNMFMGRGLKYSRELR